MADNPPPVGIGSGHLRTLGFHQYQMFDIFYGSGTAGLGGNAGSGLFLETCEGDGPLYDVWMYRLALDSGSGIDDLQVGDHLFCAYDEDESYTQTDVGWFRYDITEILSAVTSGSGEFRVKYIDDTGGLGDTDPCILFWQYKELEYGYKGAGDQWNSVIRGVNVDFLIGN